VGSGEKQRSCSPETALQLQPYDRKVEIIHCAVTRGITVIPNIAFLQGMKKWSEYANKFIDQLGTYFEEQKLINTYTYTHTHTHTHTAHHNTRNITNTNTNLHLHSDQ
jgi:hypothetical protein